MINGLYVAQNALQATQAALSVTSNNLANMSTEGYSKQRVNLSALSTNIGNDLTLQAKSGAGCEIDSITRYRDTYLDLAYRNNSANVSYYDELASAGLVLENYLNELSGSGFTQSFNDFFSAAQNLSLYPNDATMKTNFVQTAKSVCLSLNLTANNLSSQRKNYVGSIDNTSSIYDSTAAKYADSINTLTKQIADINKQISYQSLNQSTPSSTLLDERDLLLDELSEYVSINIKNTDNYGISVSIGNTYLIKNTDVTGELKVNVGDEDNPCKISIETPAGGVACDDITQIIDKGKLSAVLTIGGNTNDDLCIKTIMDKIDVMANEFANALNDIQLRKDDTTPPMVSAAIDTTTGLLKTATEPLFVNATDGTTSGISASNISINSVVVNQPEEVACAFVEAVDNINWEVKEPDELGNNKTAQAFVDLRDSNIVGLGSKTFEDFVIDITADMASKVSLVNSTLEVAETTFDSSDSQRKSATGVSLEEELTDLVKFQRSYEAAARVFTTSSEILEVLVNLGK